MNKNKKVLVGIIILIVVISCFFAFQFTRVKSTSITSYHANNQSTGVNNTETKLTFEKVNTKEFGKLYSTRLDGPVYAEPLYVPNLEVSTGTIKEKHNVVFVATEHASLYAIDAEKGNILWTTSFLDEKNNKINPLGASKIIPFNWANANSADLGPDIGITATPVIDEVNGYLYLVTKTEQTIPNAPKGTIFVQTIFKINLSNGLVANSTIIGETITDNGKYTFVTTGPASNTPYVLGTGDGAIIVDGQSRVYFNAHRIFGRVSLTLVNGVVYMGFASNGGVSPYHGWMLGYNASTLALSGVLNTTPNGGLGGIWQGAGIIAVDPQGYFYFITGNGTFNTNANNFDPGFKGLPHDANYGDSFVKVAVDPNSSVMNQNPNGWGLKVVDFFSPKNTEDLFIADKDLGSGGPTILPDEVGSPTHPHLVVGAGKEGKIFLVDRDNMGGFSPIENRVVQEIDKALNGQLNTAAFFLNNPKAAHQNSPSGTLLIAQGFGGGGKAFKVSNGSIIGTTTSSTSDNFGYAPGSPTVSANGIKNGIIWVISFNNATLYAYKADDLSVKLWDSGQAKNNRDRLGSGIKFTVPTVADGHVFVGNNDSLVGYGLLNLKR